MTYVLTIYFISALGVASVQGLTPSLTICRLEAVKIISKLDFPPSVAVHAKCVKEIEV